jgi:ribosomal protein L11 methyltransferase
MLTYTAFTTLRDRASADALGEAMERLNPEPSGVGVFEMEDGSGLWEVGGYFTERPNEVAMALLSVAFGANPFVISEVPETDWVAKVRRDLKPVIAGRFFIYGSHDKDKVPKDSIALLIEAAMAFGTGHHGTTLGCLKALDRLARDGFVGENVADIGCGTAVLAVAAASIWPNPVLASDIDAVAVEVAEANVKANSLEGKVTCLEAAGFDHDALASAAPFDLVFANILKPPLIALAPSMAAHLISGGYAILSGILREQAEEVIICYKDAGLNLIHREDIAEWSTLTLSKP